MQVKSCLSAFTDVIIQISKARKQTREQNKIKENVKIKNFSFDQLSSFSGRLLEIISLLHF